MTRLIVDASRIGNLVLQDEHSEITEALANAIASSELVEPAHWPIEVASLVVKASRRGRISPEHLAETRSAVALLLRGAEIETRSNALAAWDIAIRHRIGVYDAGYLEIALRMNLPLLTSDGPLSTAAVSVGVELIEIA